MRTNTTSSTIKSAVIETLESRELLSAAPLSIYQTPVTGGTQLQINGTNAADKITLKQNAAGITVTDGKWSTAVAGNFSSIVVRTGNGNDSVIEDASVTVSTTIVGGVGNDTFVAGSGNDTLYAGTGKNVLSAGAGNDTFVTLGSAADSVYGGSGKDTFWVNTTDKVFNVRADEVAYGGVHRVGSYFSTAPISTTTVKKASKSHKASRNVTAPPLAEPSVTTAGLTYTNFSDHPLFSGNGPTQDDIRQGNVGDCFFLATLAAVAKADPMKIQQSVVQLADGSYVVQFNKAGQEVFVHVSGSLPTYSWGTPAYANFGQQGSMWVAILEKAFTAVRNGSNSYASIDSGWMDESFSTLGLSSTGYYNPSSPTQLLQILQGQLSQGKAVTYATNVAVDGSALISGHAYEVIAVNADATGKLTSVTLRNPWGIDGAGSDSNPNDGYVTVTAQQAYGSFLGIVTAAA